MLYSKPIATNFVKDKIFVNIITKPKNLSGELASCGYPHKILYLLPKIFNDCDETSSTFERFLTETLFRSRI